MPINSESDIINTIKKMKWYSSVDFGNGIVAMSDLSSSYSPDPKSINNGEGKWHYIIRRNLHDLKGKRFLDLGCNNGTICIEAAKAGAIDVVGIDSSKLWKGWIEQAEFVKEAMEWRCNTKYPIKFIDSNITDLPALNLGYFDVVTALCCLYYLDDKSIMEVFSYLKNNAGHVVVQCNISGVHSKEINRRAKPEYMAKAIRKAGFSFIYIDKPFFYDNPVVIGTNEKFKETKCSIRSFFAWIRNKC